MNCSYSIHRQYIASTHSQRQRGFTLIEVMVTALIAVIILAIAAPAFNNLIVRQSINAQASTIASTMSAARTNAISAGGTARVCWNSGTVAATISGVSIPAGHMIVVDTAGDVIKQIQYRSDGYYIDVEPTGTCVSFDDQGRSVAAGDILFGVCREEDNAADSKIIRVGRMGRARTIQEDSNVINCKSTTT